ncbi:iron ABC transporter permease [Campylobacter fetus]|uniref:Iron ABC transporter permease n=1 Tax=Campylobacter fetus TaxID=196 RepID=A0A5L4L565_CAMFE|nr:iron ABC transporter permease [Campylobacter fetus]EAJ0326889.1 iron ABC transporter permease [Campylobacter fetus]EAJ1230251.1 iron ABC transporter permease [Campylobacter fetus]EAK0468826.1 iron ABC transporter permease [Campylobacter fetus]EAK0796935.1 iron ABC transporter permease [Campylobacter fetus]
MKILKLGAIFVALVIVFPLFFIFIEMFFGDFSLLNHFSKYLLSGYIKDTFLLLFGVLVSTITIACISAYLVVNYKFPFSRFFEFALVLPLAIPAYIFSFAYVGLMDYNGEFMKVFGFRIDMMNIWGAIFVISLSLYPYIYMFAKTSFKTGSKTVFELAKIYNINGFMTFFKISLPLARPAIFGGAMLVAMETLSDYGTAAYYGVNTFSAGIFKVWYDLDDSYLASFLAGILMVIVFFIMFAEYLNKKSYSFNNNTSLSLKPANLSKIAKFFAFLWCFTLFMIAFALPFYWLVYWSIFGDVKFDAGFIKMASNSLFIAILASVLIAAVGLFLTFSSRFFVSKLIKTMVLRCSSLGYALPGASVGVCVMIVFGYIDRNFGMSLLSSSFVVLMFGYLVRFMTASIYALDSGYSKISKFIDDASKVMKISLWNMFFKVHLPLLKHFILLAFTLAFVDIVKELPLSLILRPFEFETLSIRAFFYATDERLYSAALPSLLIVLISLCAVVFVEVYAHKKSKQSI